MPEVLEKLACEVLDDRMLEFFEEASKVKLPCERRDEGVINEFDLPYQQRTYHWVTRKAEVHDIGATWYARNGEVGLDFVVWRMFRADEDKQEQVHR
jgi:hypothetical protein